MFVLDRLEESITSQAHEVSALREERDRLDMALQVHLARAAALWTANCGSCGNSSIG